MEALEIRNGQLCIIVHPIDDDNEIEFDTSDFCLWASIDQTKQLIEFLTKQIEGK